MIMSKLSYKQEYVKLKTRAEALQHTQSNLLGEDLEESNMKDLDQLEDKLDRRIRSSEPEEIDAELQSPWNTNAGYRNTIYSSQAAQLQCNFEPLSYNDASQIGHNFINFPQSRDRLFSSNFWVFHLLKTNNFLKSSVGRSTITSNI
ncbi:hypothetical protein NL676_037710 [Syzygium grande]|nr:hypothetical protein NL676_037710 [Syzygium grande]